MSEWKKSDNVGPQHLKLTNLGLPSRLCVRPEAAGTTHGLWGKRRGSLDVTLARLVP